MVMVSFNFSTRGECSPKTRTNKHVLWMWGHLLQISFLFVTHVHTDEARILRFSI